MFIGRKEELKTLNKMYNSNKFEMAIIYGRRRVGKTTLIREFCKDKKSIYFISRESNDSINLENFSRDVFSITSPESTGNTIFSNWERAFEYIYNVSKNERIILVIDEYPYLAESNRTISSMLQAHIDVNFRKSKLFFILCGSSMSFMEYQVLGYKSPLYGRRTAQFKIKPFNYYESSKMMQMFTIEEQAILFGVTGGIPEYLSRINTNLSMKDNIIDLFLTESGILYEEPSNLLKQELREPSTYNGIIEAIASGASRLNEISTKNGIESNKCSKYIKSLLSLGIIKKEKPANDLSSKKTIYLLEDQMFRFWYKFIPKNMSSIASGLGNIVYQKYVEPEIPQYMGLTFEIICREYLIIQNIKLNLPFTFGSIGRWWGNNPEEKKQEEIDIIAFDDKNIIFGECKWRNEKTGIKICNELIKKSTLIKNYENKYYYIFSKSGFTNELIEKSKDMNIVLVSLENIYRI